MAYATATNIAPVESPQAREALVEAYKALRVLNESCWLAYIGNEGHDPKAAEQARYAIDVIEERMSPNLLITVLPSYTEIRFATDQSREGETQTGIIRDGAWGLYPDERTDATERRITTNGWEFFVTPETVFTFFQIIERPEVKA